MKKTLVDLMKLIELNVEESKVEDIKEVIYEDLYSSVGAHQVINIKDMISKDDKRKMIYNFESIKEILSQQYDIKIGEEFNYYVYTDLEEVPGQFFRELEDAEIFFDNEEFGVRSDILKEEDEQEISM